MTPQLRSVVVELRGESKSSDTSSVKMEDVFLTSKTHKVWCASTNPIWVGNKGKKTS